MSEFCADRGLSHDVPTLHRRKAELYAKLICTDLRLMPGARECLDALRTAGRRRALATAGFPNAVMPALDHLHLRHEFDVIVTRADVTRMKPAPDVFLLAAARLGVEPRECLVLEDAEKGVRAAHAAGMRCIAVPTEHTRDNDFSLADRVLPSLRDVTIGLIDEMG